MRIIHLIIIAVTLLHSCTTSTEIVGVSQELANVRKESIDSVEYELFFSIPNKTDKQVRGEANITFTTNNTERIVFDFKTDLQSRIKAIVNGEICDLEIDNEHIVIPRDHITSGKNNVHIYFDAPSTSLNRRQDYLYTLLVPDRARTLFPCFDQPNIKAKYSLKLAVPMGWSAVANGSTLDIDTIHTHQMCEISFAQTKPISTYLFAFSAGKFKKEQFSDDKHSIWIYHRERDPKKIAQLEHISNEVFKSLNWLERYTKIDYPFEKYDLVILPGFQYGGMEHMGATFYNDNRMFLPENPSFSSIMSRSSLIAHETSHMWFGDYVTMDWFNEVWLKEVFANYYANEIIKDWYPDLDQRENFTQYFGSAYLEDRTPGTNSLTQKLDNLEDAGLIYGKIIYNKAPIVMQMMVKIIGKKRFDDGIREYLRNNAYGNATWNNLVSTLDKYTVQDLKGWSKVWVDTKGMPTIESAINNDTLYVVQYDPLNRGVVWNQKISFLAEGDDFSTPVTIKTNKSTHAIKLPENTKYLLPNWDMQAYGFFVLDSVNIAHSIKSLMTSTDPIIKHSILYNLQENMLNQYISPNAYSNALIKYLKQESSPLLFNSAINNLYYCYTKTKISYKTTNSIEKLFWDIATNDENISFRKSALQKLINGAQNNSTKARLLQISNNPEQLGELDESDRINLAYHLSIYFPELSDTIINKQRLAISNPDKLDEFNFISRAVNQDSLKIEQLFEELLLPQNRTIEPWALSALRLIIHPAQKYDRVKFIEPALEALPEIQKTNDIFFTQNWCSALLYMQNSKKAREVVENFIEKNREQINPMLITKIKQQL